MPLSPLQLSFLYRVEITTCPSLRFRYPFSTGRKKLPAPLPASAILSLPWGNNYMPVSQLQLSFLYRVEITTCPLSASAILSLPSGTTTCPSPPFSYSFSPWQPYLPLSPLQLSFLYQAKITTCPSPRFSYPFSTVGK
jgi:hypothetical protein